MVKDKKVRSAKAQSDKNNIKIPAKMSATAANAKPDTVLKVRAGKRVKGPVAKRIILADQLFEAGMNKLMEEVKRVVNI